MPIRFFFSFLFFITFFSCQFYRMDSPQMEVVSEKDNLDVDERYRLNQNYPLTLNKIQRGKVLQLEDVVNMTKAGVSDDAIIAEIKATQSAFYLTEEDIEELRHEGVSEKVISYMGETGRL